jgi:hypothetical protein
MGSGAMIYILTFIKIDGNEGTWTYRQHGDRISLNSFFKIRKTGETNFAIRPGLLRRIRIFCVNLLWANVTDSGNSHMNVLTCKHVTITQIRSFKN